MYQTIASGGFRSPLRAIREVTTQEGKPLQRYALAVEQAFPPEPMYLLDRRDAGRGARRHRPGAEEPSCRRRSASRARPAPPTSSATPGSPASPAIVSRVVWVGYDDNRAARLSGAAAALPVWGDMMAALAPEPLALAKPERIENVLDRPAERAARRQQLPRRARASFRPGLGAARRAPCARPGRRARSRRSDRPVEKAKSWFERLFGDEILRSLF